MRSLGEREGWGRDVSVQSCGCHILGYWALGEVGAPWKNEADGELLPAAPGSEVFAGRSTSPESTLLHSLGFEC